MTIQRYLMVTCQVCNAVKCADRSCHYCGATGPIEGKYYNRSHLEMARAAGHTLYTKIVKVADRLGMAA